MSKHIQIRDIPDETHGALKARAAQAGMSMSDYLKRMIERELKIMTWEEFDKKVKSLEPISLPVSTVDLVREERDSR